MKKLLFSLLYLLAFVGIFSSCDNSDPIEPQPWPDSNHTLLIYMVGDNNLSGDLRGNIRDAINGLKGSDAPLNLVIYEDTKASGYKGTPVLFRLRRNRQNKEKVDTIMIHQFEEDHNSLDPAIMQSIIKEAFEACPAEVKGISFGSHALGWAPSSVYSPTFMQAPERTTDGKRETRAKQWFGIEENNKYMEIWDLRKALEGGPHLDYLLFDACHMAQVEVAYELRKTADYLVGCPTETWAEGFPYAELVKTLSSLTTKSALAADISLITDVVTTQPIYQRKGGTFTIVDLNQLTPVHQAYKNLLAMSDERLTLLKDHIYTYIDDIQQFGRVYMGASYLFYDMQSFADFLVEYKQEDSAEYQQLMDALKKAVISEYHTDVIEYSPFSMYVKTCCGLGVGIPEVIGSISIYSKTYLSAYNELQWAKD